MEDPSRRFLLQLRKETGGDPSRTVSLYEIGRQLGWQRPEALRAAENLMAEGFVEVRSLSGAVAISRAGLSAAEAELAAASPASPPLRLGPAPVLENGMGPRLLDLLREIRLRLDAGGGPPGDRRREFEADLRTIEAQLGSPRPKNAVLREAFRSIAENLGEAAAGDPLPARLRSLIDSGA